MEDCGDGVACLVALRYLDYLEEVVGVHCVSGCATRDAQMLEVSGDGVVVDAEDFGDGP